MSNKGWIKTHRSLLHSEIFQNDKLLKIFMWCNLKASHTEHEQLVGRQKVRLQPGQFVFGRTKASAELGYAPSTVWDYMKLLESKGTIGIKPNNKFSVVTIENWGIYQNDIDILDNKSTTNQQQKDTNKNVKNDKNKKLFVEASNEYRLAKYLFEHMKRNNANAKEPNYQTWCKQLDYILRLDKRDLEEVKRVISWCQNDNFWLGNILSPLSLRKSYDKLILKMKQEQQITEKPKEEFNAFSTEVRL